MRPLTPAASPPTGTLSPSQTAPAYPVRPDDPGSAPGGNDLGTERSTEWISPRVFLAAVRYWILRYEDKELRFSLRASAEEWAARLAPEGIAWVLSWHDENTESSIQTERHAA